MKALVVINDLPIRQLAFSKAERLIKKIDKLEKDLDTFSLHDQQLFTSWFELTFRKERKKIAERHDAFRALARFHNWILGLADQLDISLPKAYAFLRAEEDEYANGTDAVRAQIEEKRRQRDDELRKAYEDQHRQQAGDDRADESDDADEPRDLEAEAELETIRQMSDDDLSAACSQRDGAFRFLAVVLQHARTLDDQALFIRIWELVPNKLRAAFSKEFLKQMGYPITRMIDEYRRQIAQGARDEDDDNEDEYADEGFNSSSFRGAAVDFEAAKFLYRKLVRHLHPDLQESADGPSHWQTQIWHRVQTAYARHDQRELEKIYRLVLIRGRHFAELSVSEILESERWLQDEFDQLAREAQSLRRRPAWGFSKKTDFASVQRKLEKPMKEELKQIEANIRALEAEHAYFEMLGRMDLNEDRHRRKRAKARRRHGRR